MIWLVVKYSGMLHLWVNQKRTCTFLSQNGLLYFGRHVLILWKGSNLGPAGCTRFCCQGFSIEVFITAEKCFSFDAQWW